MFAHRAQQEAAGERDLPERLFARAKAAEVGVLPRACLCSALRRVVTMNSAANALAREILECGAGVPQHAGATERSVHRDLNAKPHELLRSDLAFARGRTRACRCRGHATVALAFRLHTVHGCSIRFVGCAAEGWAIRRMFLIAPVIHSPPTRP